MQLGVANIWGFISRLRYQAFFLDLWHSESYDYSRISALIKEKENVSGSHDYAGRCIVVAIKETQLEREKETKPKWKAARSCHMNSNLRFLNSWHWLCRIAILKASAVGVGIAALAGVNLFPLHTQTWILSHTLRFPVILLELRWPRSAWGSNIFLSANINTLCFCI